MFGDIINPAFPSTLPHSISTQAVTSGGFCLDKSWNPNLGAGTESKPPDVFCRELLSLREPNRCFFVCFLKGILVQDSKNKIDLGSRGRFKNIYIYI